MNDFRFENLEIWKKSIAIAQKLFQFADKAEIKRKYRFAEQLRGAALSISNNISEGSGSFSNKEFAQFLNIARRSLFECANMLFIFEQEGIIYKADRIQGNQDLLSLSKMITKFRKTLLR